nr:MAG TPA: hypothetical protein [Bacteriophage sp.]
MANSCTKKGNIWEKYISIRGAEGVTGLLHPCFFPFPPPLIARPSGRAVEGKNDRLSRTS